MEGANEGDDSFHATQAKNPVEDPIALAKARRMDWNNMNMNSVRLDIAREKIDLMVGEVELGKVDL